jgi:hypothetical protein
VTRIGGAIWITQGACARGRRAQQIHGVRRDADSRAQAPAANGSRRAPALLPARAVALRGHPAGRGHERRSDVGRTTVYDCEDGRSCNGVRRTSATAVSTCLTIEKHRHGAPQGQQRAEEASVPLQAVHTTMTLGAREHGNSRRPGGEKAPHLVRARGPARGKDRPSPGCDLRIRCLRLNALPRAALDFFRGVSPR